MAFTAPEGVPLIWPVAAFNVIPPGRAPAVTCQVTVPAAPLAAIVAEYGTPTWPFGSESVVIESSVLATLIVKLFVAEDCTCAESFTWIVTDPFTTVPDVVPLIRPEDGNNVHPAGKLPPTIDHV